jgi:hypothetical protein
LIINATQQKQVIAIEKQPLKPSVVKKTGMFNIFGKNVSPPTSAPSQQVVVENSPTIEVPSVNFTEPILAVSVNTVASGVNGQNSQVFPSMEPAKPNAAEDKLESKVLKEITAVVVKNDKIPEVAVTGLVPPTIEEYVIEPR